MPEMKLILNDTFWKFLVSLEELSEKKEKALFCSSLELDDTTLAQFQEHLNRFDIVCEYDDSYIYPLKNKCRIKIEFSISEWFALQASFHKEENQDKFEHYYQKIIQNKLMAVEKAYEQFNLYKKPSKVLVKPMESDKLKKKIDYAVSYKKPIHINFLNKKECNILPHRMVFLDGILCVVGESINDKSLVFFGLEDIEDVQDANHEYEANLSQIEINEFICHLRVVNGKEERLILKINSQYEADLLPSHHFLGNPFVTFNSEGEMIWAATLEVCEDLYIWMYGMKDRVEILDPGHVKKEFQHYCDIREENPELKKVS